MNQTRYRAYVSIETANIIEMVYEFMFFKYKSG